MRIVRLEACRELWRWEAEGRNGVRVDGKESSELSAGGGEVCGVVCEVTNKPSVAYLHQSRCGMEGKGIWMHDTSIIFI